MTRLLLRYTTVIFIALYCISAGSCSPSPRYRGGTAKHPSGSGPRGRPAEPAPAEVDIVLRYPLGGTGKVRISSPFGMRTHPSYGTQEFHQGVDFEAETGEDVYAAAAGRVTYAGRQKGYGKVVIIDHGRDISSVYAHLSSTAVRKGVEVESGQRIGKVGVSGNATGSHLHFELRVSGNAVDPLDYMEIR